MKTLVAFYSLEGNCRDLGKRMAEALSCDVMEIVPVKQSIPDKGFFRLFKGGKESIMKETPELLPFALDPAGYELIIVGGPVWAWNMSPPVRTFLSRVDWNGRRAGLYCMHRGGKGSTLGNMRTLVEAGGGTVLGAADFRDLRGGDADATRKRAFEWARGLAAEKSEG